MAEESSRCRRHRPMDLREEGRPAAGVIERVDADEEKVYVSRTKDQIKDSPKFGEADLDADARGQVGDYYGPGGAGARVG